MSAQWFITGYSVKAEDAIQISLAHIFLENGIKTFASSSSSRAFYMEKIK